MQPAVALIVKVPQFAAKSRTTRQLHFSIKHGVKQTLHINKYSKSTPPSASYFSGARKRLHRTYSTKHMSRVRERLVPPPPPYNLLLCVGAKYIRAARAACAQPKQIKAARSWRAIFWSRLGAQTNSAPTLAHAHVERLKNQFSAPQSLFSRLFSQRARAWQKVCSSLSGVSVLFADGRGCLCT